MRRAARLQQRSRRSAPEHQLSIASYMHPKKSNRVWSISGYSDTSLAIGQASGQSLTHLTLACLNFVSSHFFFYEHPS